jgi:hypothetical protein
MNTRICRISQTHSIIEQHKLSRGDWEERICKWHSDHRGMLKYVCAGLSAWLSGAGRTQCWST